MGAFLKTRAVWLTMLTLLSWYLFPLSSLAQITFERIYGGNNDDRGDCVQQTQDGGYVIAAQTNSFGTGAYDVYLIKTDPLGDTMWTRTYGGSGYDYGECIQQTQDGGYIISGWTDSFGAGRSDVYLVKTDSMGDTVWTRTYGGSDDDRSYSVQQTHDGGYIIGGWTQSFGAGSYDVYLIKTDSLGDTVWTKTYGGSEPDYGRCVQQTHDGGFIATASTYSFGAGVYDVYLIKTDPLGDTMWTRTYGGSDNDGGYSVQQTQDSGYIVAGWTYSFGSGSYDVYLIKTDSLGDILWTRTYGGGSGDGGFSVQQTQDGGFIIAGRTYSFGAGWCDVYLIKTNSLGDSLWTRTYGGGDNDYGECTQQTQDGGYIIAGWRLYLGGNVSDVYLIKTDENGLVGITEDQENRRSKIENRGLLQNHPNPFQRSTLISYSLPAPAQVTLDIYDISGRLVETLVNEKQEPGVHQVRWGRKTKLSGVYFYRLEAGEFTDMKKMVLVR